MKRLLLGVVLAVPAFVGLGTSTYAPKAEAAPAQSCEWDYFSDDTYSEMVGNETQTCSGRRYLSGVRTSYSRLVYCFPC
ncbi:hypothetical protein HUA74_03320 [Myxococcus sp. CA051A]|uniref:DUF6289 family protein n=1 Tax=unclassified Myxococcus TaxID=2648731 RepID=UPI00157AF3F7|nr:MULTISPECIES: DUF6289 family protein [unclassified Myxococcus]NTX33253.1 hypothetical protein [Myxococcus sp. CA033]NTX52405.1 hypothetical protein [Myxococcus sp. CA039A]NTX59683.1 hypothetical protein [Myxococcus sp. CA051A]